MNLTLRGSFLLIFGDTAFKQHRIARLGDLLQDFGGVIHIVGGMQVGAGEARLHHAADDAAGEGAAAHQNHGVSAVGHHRAQREIGPVTATNYIYIIPLVGMLTSVLMLDEPANATMVLGSVLILSGVFLGQRR
ncbi:MAG: DMT family transporter [Oxalobacter sp.]|nr:DMT family transporter [Oxalobacter sp.]